jgi:hypothetical protein
MSTGRAIPKACLTLTAGSRRLVIMVLIVESAQAREAA